MQVKNAARECTRAALQCAYAAYAAVKRFQYAAQLSQLMSYAKLYVLCSTQNA